MGEAAVFTDSIGLRSEAESWIDVAVFEALTASLTASLTAAHLPSAKLTQEGLDDLSEATRLYCGDFMAGFNLADCPEFDEWQFFQREHWQGVALRSMDALSRAYEANGEHQEAISCARRRLSFDRLHDPTHLRLMQFYRQTDEKAAAMRQDGLLKRLLKVELNAAPQDGTIKLYRTIRSERGAVPLVKTTTLPKIRYAKSGNTYIAYQHLGKGPVDILFVSG